MTEPIVVLLTALRLFVLALGIAITYTSYRAYVRTGAPYLRNASLGFGIVSIGVFIEGILFTILDFSLHMAHVVESGLIAVGFIFILYSFRQ